MANVKVYNTKTGMTLSIPQNQVSQMSSQWAVRSSPPAPAPAPAPTPAAPAPSGGGGGRSSSTPAPAPAPTGTWITNPTTGIATNTATGATFQAQNPAYSPPAASTPTPEHIAEPEPTPALKPALTANIAFKEGLTTEQKNSVEALASKPTESWTETDKKNWNYATNNAPMPAPTPASAPAPAPTPAPTGGITRNLTAEQEFVKNWAGKEGRLPTSSEVNQAVYGTPTPKFSTPQGVQPPATPTASAVEGEVTPAPKPDDYQAELNNYLFNNYGINLGTVNPVFQDPITTIKGIITDVMSVIGVPEVKTQLEAIAKVRTGLVDERDEEIAEVNTNPWISEAMRTRKITAIETKYENKIANKNSEFDLLQNIYDDARQEAQFAASLGVGLFESNRDFLQGQMEDLMNRAEKAAAVKKKETQEERELSMEGYQYLSSPEQLKGLTEEQIYRDPATGRIYKRPKEKDELLSVAEAKSLGVPYGTTKEQAAQKGIISTTKKTGTPEVGGYPKGFWSSIKTATTSLRKGEQWGTVYNRLKMQFPDVSNENLDTALGTEWRKEGAFEEYKQKQYKEKAPKMFELESGVWQWLATEEAQNMTNEQKRQEIMTAGFSPDDFGIY